MDALEQAEESGVTHDGVKTAVPLDYRRSWRISDISVGLALLAAEAGMSVVFETLATMSMRRAESS